MTRLRRHGPWLAALIAFAAVVTWWWHRPLPEPGTLPPPRYLLLIDEDGMYGAIDLDGNVVVPATYETIVFVGATQVHSGGFYYAESVWGGDIRNSNSYHEPGAFPTAWMRVGKPRTRWRLAASWPFVRRETEVRYDILDSHGQIVLLDVDIEDWDPVIQQHTEPPRNYLVREDGQLELLRPLRDTIYFVTVDGMLGVKDDTLANYSEGLRLIAPDGREVVEPKGLAPVAPGLYLAIPEDTEDLEKRFQLTPNSSRTYVSSSGEKQSDLLIVGLDHGFYVRIRAMDQVELVHHPTGHHLLLNEKPSEYVRPIALESLAAICPVDVGSYPGYLAIILSDKLQIFDTDLRLVYTGEISEGVHATDLRYWPSRPDRLYYGTSDATNEINLSTGERRQLLGDSPGHLHHRVSATRDGVTLWGLQDDDGRWVLEPTYTRLTEDPRGGYLVGGQGETTAYGIVVPDRPVILPPQTHRAPDRHGDAESGHGYRMFAIRVVDDQIWVNDDPGRRPSFLQVNRSPDADEDDAFDMASLNVLTVFGYSSRIESHGAFDVLCIKAIGLGYRYQYWIYDHGNQDWWPEPYVDVSAIDYDILFVRTADGDFGYRRADGSWLWRSDPGMK